ncbi:MAG: NAD-dependent epimerase/dehydratase family protein [Erythrobacter sp.]
MLVTGATGYIAGELIRQLLAKGWTVHGTVRNVT